jgi:hypothetical protein
MLSSGMAASPRPADIQLELALNPAAPAGLQDLGAAYWKIAGLDPETGELVWACRTSDLDFKFWSGSAHYAAAAAVTVTAPDYSCLSCGGNLTLTSRQALIDVRRGKGVDCRSCNVTVEERAASVLSPKSLEKRSRKACEAAARRRAAEDARQLEQIKREAVAARYPIEEHDSELLIDQVSLIARVGALAVLHAVGDTGGLIYPVRYRDDTIGPTTSFSRELFTAAWHADLLQIHPSSPTNAFVWESEAELGDGIYVDLARFYTPGTGTLEHRLEVFSRDLRASLELAAMWSTERSELAELAHRVIAEEAARYFVYLLREHNLPDLTEKHEEALRTTTTRGASLFSIGHMYRMAWTSARDASSAYQRNLGMPKENAITYGLRQLERWVQRAADDASQLGATFGEEKTKLPLSAVTGVVFRTIMGLDPLNASPATIAAALEEAPDAEALAECDINIPEHHELMEWIRTATEKWDGSEFRRVLAVLETQEMDVCAPHCAHERVSEVARESGLLYDRTVSRLGETDAAIVTAEATRIANVSQGGTRTGDALLADVIRQLRG